MSSARGNIRMQALVLGAGALLMAAKFIAWRITHSNVVLSDALESIVNVVAGGFALYSLILAAKPRDREHPYGHGKVEFISAAVEGSMVAVAGGIILYQAVGALVNGLQVHELGTGAVIVGLTGVVNLAMGLALRRRGRRQHSAALQAEGTHLHSDAWSTAALLVGLLLIHITGIMWLDSLFAMGFAAFIIRQGLRVVRRNVGGIMDETDMAVAAEVIGILDANRRPAWIDIHNFRVIQFGSTLHIDCHVTLPYYYSLEKAHHEISDMDLLVNRTSGREAELFIHMDPCIPTSCPICLVADCPVRQAPFVQRVPWTLTTALENKKHGADGRSPLKA